MSCQGRRRRQHGVRRMYVGPDNIVFTSRTPPEVIY
jgi:hypothetical protein